jgi:hypothetical protein
MVLPMTVPVSNSLISFSIVLHRQASRAILPRRLSPMCWCAYAVGRAAQLPGLALLIGTAAR